MASLRCELLPETKCINYPDCGQNKVNQFAGIQGKFIIFLTMKSDLSIPNVLGENLQFSGTFSPRETRTVHHLSFSYEHGHLGYHTAKHN